MKNLAVFLKYIMEISLDMITADSALLLLPQQGKEDFIISAIKTPVKYVSEKDRIVLEKAVCKWVVQEHKEPSLLKDTHTRPWKFGCMKQSHRIKSIICLPFKIENHISDALILVRSIDKDNFSSNDLAWAKLIGYEFEIIIKNLKSESLSERNYLEIITALFTLIELKSPLTGGHSEGVKKIALFIAQKMGLLEERIELIRRAALLHDIGKLTISDNILKKPGPLNDREWEEIRKHPYVGTKILKPLKGLKDILPFIYYHHEHYNGQGYPAKLKGEEIPFEVRILSMADALEAMSATRHYRMHLTGQQILQEIKKGAGEQFDPGIAECVLRSISENELNFNRILEKKILLIIDDDKNFCRMIKMNLELFDNYQVISADKGKAGIKIAEQTQPDLILIDLVMPDMGGFEVLRTLKKDKKTRNIPVAILTGEDNDTLRQRALKLNSVDYIIKTTETDELKIRIKKIVSSKCSYRGD